MHKRTYENSIENILKNKRTVYVFDVDGTLTDFNYHLRTFNTQIEIPNDYNYIRPLKTMQRFISKLNLDNVYICSRSIFDEECKSKTKFLQEHFNIKEENIYYVQNNKDKLEVFKSIQKITGIEDELLVIIEDHPGVLNDVLENTNYSELHVSYFIE